MPWMDGGSASPAVLRSTKRAHRSGGATTEDAFLGGAVIAEQPAKGYRSGIDAVLLAASVQEAAGTKQRKRNLAAVPDDAVGARILDVGAGVGIVGLCIAARCMPARITLFERDAELCRLARGNIARNARNAAMDVVEADVTNPPKSLRDSTFDHIVANPPYYDAARHRPSPDSLRMAAHVMPPDGLDQWARFMARFARPGGTATLIQPADKLAQILDVFGGRFGSLHVLPLHPNAKSQANRVIVRGTKGARGPLKLLPGLVVHGPDTAYTPQVDSLLRAPNALDLDAFN